MLLFRCSTRALGYQTQLSSATRGTLSKMTSQRRCLASLRVRRMVPLSDKPINAASWQAPGSSKQISDFLKQLKDLVHYRPEYVHTVVVLVTPSFTHWLDEDNHFLARLVHHLRFRNSSGTPTLPNFTIKTRSAVVDSIPSDTKLTMRSQTSNRGNEGISILVSESVHHSLAANPATPGARSQHAHLQFIAHLGYQNEQVIGLPVANTTFRNGRESTLFEDVWELRHELEDGTRFKRLSRVPLKSFDIAISSPTAKSSPYVGMPMVPLTRPYEIMSSIGNVIRELKRGDTGELFPASTDLEAAVPQFLKSLWLTEQAKKAFSVFALISPKDFYASASAEVIAGVFPPGRRFLLWDMFEGRARLHRVTGGGGGWGNKKGLLSLEPGTDVFANEGEESPKLPSQGETYKFQSLSALASPGDNIQFFATFPGPQGPKTDSSTPETVKELTFLEKEAVTVEKWRKRSARMHPPRVVIGTSTPNEQYSTASPDAPSLKDKFLFMPNFFGMLSEGGACVGHLKIDDSPSAKDTPITFTSRLDIPFTTLIASASLRDSHSRAVVRQVEGDIHVPPRPLVRQVGLKIHG